MSGGVFNVYEAMKSIAKIGLEGQKKNPEDHIGPDGLLVCGKCGEPKQKYRDFPNPTIGDPNRTSPLLVATQCRCEREMEAQKEKEKRMQEDLERIQKLRSASLMDEKFESSTFEQFRVTHFNERNLKLCKRYAEKFDLMVEKNQGLIFWGDVGTGKSFAAACIANYLLDRKIPVVMTSFVKLLEVIQNSKDQESGILTRFNHARLVIFDDLGAERGTDYALEKVYNIVDSRYRKKLPMILTTNLTLQEMKEEDDIRYSRIYDRIFEVCYPMQFTGQSWRKREASHRFNEIEKLLDDNHEGG